jgi:hypothetical protein
MQNVLCLDDPVAGFQADLFFVVSINRSLRNEP